MNQLAPSLADLSPVNASFGGDAEDSANATHLWQIRCVEFTPRSAPDTILLGFATFELLGGMRIADVRVIKTAKGIGITLPYRIVMRGRAPAQLDDGAWWTVWPVEFPKASDWLAFCRAAVEAVRAAYPDALPPPAPPGEAPHSAGSDSDHTTTPHPPIPVSAPLAGAQHMEN